MEKKIKPDKDNQLFMVDEALNDGEYEKVDGMAGVLRCNSKTMLEYLRKREAVMGMML